MALENKLRLTSSADLAREEERISKKKAVWLFESGTLDKLPVGTFASLKAIHKALFEDIYDFAGELRTVNLAKGNFRFAPLMYLEAALANIVKLLSAIESVFTVLCPFFIHLFVVFFDECLNFADFPIRQNPLVLKNTVAVALNKELGGTGFGQLFIAGVDVHTFHNAERRKIEVISRNLKLVIFRHLTPPYT